LTTFAAIFAAYILADMLSGLYHCATDYGFNVRNQIEMFQEHHVTNTMLDFDWQTFAAAMPLVALGGWLHSAFLIALGCFIALTQVTHYYAHRRSSSRLVHHVVSALQLARVIVPPASHSRHHSGEFNRDFCLLSGWCNPVLNAVVALFERRAMA
jgi:palmitoyl-[glycerolipid] 3-(E)-desaturase